MNSQINEKNEIIEKERNVLLKIGKTDTRELIHFKTFHIVTNIFMNELIDSIRRLGIKIEIKKTKLKESCIKLTRVFKSFETLL